MPELAGLQALNLIESVTQPDQSVLAEVYAATAVHAELRTRGQFSLVTRWYWLLAKRAQARRMDIKLGDRAHNSLQWLFEPMGFQFLIRGRFSSKQVRDTFGQRMPPGSLEHAARAFRLDILKRGVDEMLTTGDPDKCTELFNELVVTLPPPSQTQSQIPPRELLICQVNFFPPLPLKKGLELG